MGSSWVWNTTLSLITSLPTNANDVLRRRFLQVFLRVVERALRHITHAQDTRGAADLVGAPPLDVCLFLVHGKLVGLEHHALPRIVDFSGEPGTGNASLAYAALVSHPNTWYYNPSHGCRALSRIGQSHLRWSFIPDLAFLPFFLSRLLVGLDARRRDRR